EVGRRVADHAQDLAGRGLLILRLNQLAVARLELPQRLCQALLNVVSRGALALLRLARARELGLDFSLRGLSTTTHRPLLACSSRYHRAGTDDRLGERVRVGKWEAAGNSTRVVAALEGRFSSVSLP